MQRRKSITRLVATAAVLAIVATACGSNDDDDDSASPATTTAAAAEGTATTAATPTATGDGPGVGSKAVGFIFVGPKDDFGYNQAAYEGSQAVKAAYPALDIITAENVPETDEAARVMESMIDKGAKIIFATSYGHLDAALKVAADHPDVAVVQQGNTISGSVPPNAGTFFGTVYEPVYLAGIVAGKETKSDKLGYVYAFPIPQTVANINAFELGAKSVNPDVKTYTVNTSSWCDPAKQADAAKSLLGQGVDVLTQHQDCQATVVKAAEQAGAMVVGYHEDASSLAPKGWIAGSEWAWGDLYVDIVKTALAGTFTGSPYNANFRAGFKDGDNPFVTSKFGPQVETDVQDLVASTEQDLSSDTSVFTGPINGQDGTVVIPAGTTLDAAQVDAMDFFVEGVVGDIPKS
jgi:simple sugar transport system substrate-binding protein/basic membrane protein A